MFNLSLPKPGRPVLPMLNNERLKPMAMKVLNQVDKRIPFTLKKRLIEDILNRAFAVALSDGEFDYLEGRALGLEVTDLDLRLAFGCENERLVVMPGYGCDAWIKGASRELMKLANRSEDPDTLFFQRRLLIEGDTELGLGTKNLLDSIDWSELPPLFQKGLGLMERLS